jgi:SWI/SNF related-matrix-associated actin-dependent regulator of chromatin subfamily C
MSGRNPKGAALGASHYESSEIVDCFQDLVKPLSTDFKQRDISFNARDLSLLVGQLQQFQQECLGAFNRPATAPIRIPAKFFRVKSSEPLTKESAVYTILRSAYQFRLNHSWKKWDFGNPAKKQRNADLIQAIRTNLIKKGFITIPKISIMDPVTETTRKSIISLIKKVGGKLI